MNIESIKEKVRLVKLSHEDKSILEIFRDLNFIIGYIPDNCLCEEKPKGCNIKSDYLRAVLIDPNLSENELLEVYAHELGHIFLHPNINTFAINEIDPIWVRHLEIEADTFACEYLLDDDVFEKYIDMTFEEIACELGVSIHLVKLKFNNLSDNKKKELEEIYIENYSLFNSI